MLVVKLIKDRDRVSWVHLQDRAQRPADCSSRRLSSSEPTGSIPRSLSLLARPSVAALPQRLSPSTAIGTGCRSKVARSIPAPDSQPARGRQTTGSP